MAVDDHGLEVLKKSGFDLSGNKTDYAVQTLPKLDYDYLSRTVLAEVETYTFKMGGSSGTLVRTITVTYTDGTLTTLSTVEIVDAV